MYHRGIVTVEAADANNLFEPPGGSYCRSVRYSRRRAKGEDESGNVATSPSKNIFSTLRTR